MTLNTEPAPGSGSAPVGRDDRTLVLVAYGLMVAGIIIPFAPIAGVILAYIKRGEVSATLWANHYSNVITTFWYSLIGAVIGAVLALIMIGWLVMLAVAVWFLYRCIRGLLAATEGRPYPSA